MSKLSYIDKSHGNSIIIAVANTDPRTIIECGKLPNNAIVVSAEPNENYEDTGVTALFVTDYEGTPVRLSYNIHEGNGLYFNNDTLYLNIDKDTIVHTGKGLTVNVENLIDNKSVKYINSKLKIDTDNLNIATENNPGVVKIDNDTIFINDECLEVNTTNLLKSSYSTCGICASDNHTISSDNGVLSINTTNLIKATNKTFGTAKPDNSTVVCNNNKIYINTHKLEQTDLSGKCGIMTNGDMILINDGILSVNVDSLSHASTTKYGTAKFNNDEFETENGIVTVKNYNKTLNYINECVSKINTINSMLKK